MQQEQIELLNRVDQDCIEIKLGLLELLKERNPEAWEYYSKQMIREGVLKNFSVNSSVGEIAKVEFK